MRTHSKGRSRAVACGAREIACGRVRCACGTRAAHARARAFVHSYCSLSLPLPLPLLLHLPLAGCQSVGVSHAGSNGREQSDASRRG